jgi:hypothetical protein
MAFLTVGAWFAALSATRVCEFHARLCPDRGLLRNINVKVWQIMGTCGGQALGLPLRCSRQARRLGYLV